jgi:RNA-directed DNA polymerase
MESVTEFLEKKLRLKVNREKSAVAKPRARKFLGLRIVGRGVKSFISIAPKSLRRFKDEVRRITRRNRGVSLVRVLTDLRRYTEGWAAYFCVARTPSVYKELDGWIRRRLRCYIYKQWKKPRKRAKELIKLGVGPWLAWGVAYGGYGYWKVAGCPAMSRAITDQRLESLGYRSLHKQYLVLTST